MGSSSLQVEDQPSITEESPISGKNLSKNPEDAQRKPPEAPSQGKPVVSITLMKQNPPEKEEDEITDSELEVSHTTPSPKPLVSSPQISVKNRRAKFEKEARKNVKDMSKDSRYQRKRASQKSPERRKVVDPMTAFMNEMRTSMRDMKSTLNKTTEKLDSVNDKIDRVERYSRKIERENKREFVKLRKGIDENKSQLKEEVVKLVIDQIKPKVQNFQTEVKSDLRKIIQDKIKSQIPSEEQSAEEEEENTATDIGSMAEKSPKSKKNKKHKKNNKS